MFYQRLFLWKLADLVKSMVTDKNEMRLQVTEKRFVSKTESNALGNSTDSLL